MSDLNEIQKAAQKQFDQRSDHYGKSHVLSQTDDIESALSFLNPQPQQHLLDIATGAGHTALFFARRHLQVTAADISSAMLKQTSKQAEEENLTLQTQNHSAEKMPYEDKSFDFVTCRIAAHHFSCPASFVMEVKRVLKPGGKFLLIDGTVEDDHPIAEEWMHQIEKLRDPSHNRLVSPNKWIHLCGHVGMKTIHHEIHPLKQPDLQWYFETADTSPENREQVLHLVHHAPEEAKELFELKIEKEKITWWWQRLILVAERL